MEDLSRIEEVSSRVYAVNPSSLFDDSIMTAYEDRDTALSNTE